MSRWLEPLCRLIPHVARRNLRATRAVMDLLAALGRADPSRFWDLLRHLAGAPDWSLRHFAGRAAGALYGLDPAGVAAHLAALAQDPDPRVREGAAVGLAAALPEHFAALYPTLAAWAGPEAHPRLRALVALALVAAPAHRLPPDGLFALVDRLCQDVAPEVVPYLGRYLLGRTLARAYPDRTRAYLDALAQGPAAARRLAQAARAAAPPATAPPPGTGPPGPRSTAPREE